MPPATSPKEAPKRRALGRGLDTLLPRAAAPAPAKPAPEPEPKPQVLEGTPREIPVGEIDKNPYQTRTRFDETQLNELAASIAATGVVQPILVRPLANGRFQLIAGERRWLASQRAGKETIPAILKTVSDELAMEMTIVENLQRTDLNPMEQARAYNRLAGEFKMTQEQMAKRTGKDRASVSNFLRLLRLPEAIQAKVEAAELSFGHARALLALENPETILSAAQKVLALSMSVRQTESYVQGILNPEKKEKGKEKEDRQAGDPNVREAELRIQRALGLKVRIEDKKGRGRVIIEYARLEDFDALLDHFDS
ncbi:ParB/RepB/Spo0J family partition protein [Silvibacterium dinghuense]|uniref:ParB/RepB/Spo0J family partition protein n=1 Tax=Silvibacterium dinghuense TaxID=1560006 RepID=A0A4Q1SKL1_9BACT|nr:ParB/RepB/Spo0J family partition protein [Silvibacterium dinghuense]RXS97840.1 ParB/RepB/Spo0J family partition protein [Silvibacterium dinghuense]GGH02360.1 chromosome partitioning protein [Silvibacterium dinghuense]